ncbi:hypothetical protein AVEN_181080-1 [Araneus ventricosus]|uniref:Uncharacterized protein n=1 Tax=Araneus ventricosus TaxID=182803 RepID=A0A4Y2VDZ4_ARAVE|nr:hypothetical protein AVEN_181080-1 [Araneus ventricosus]
MYGPFATRASDWSSSSGHFQYLFLRVPLMPLLMSVGWVFENKSISQVQRKSRITFHRSFLETTSLLDRPRSGRSRTSDHDVERIHQIFIRNPAWSTRSVSRELGIQWTTVRRYCFAVQT